MVGCSVFGCNSSGRHSSQLLGIKLSFFRFPVQPNLREEWLKATFRTDEFNIKNGRVCSKHFQDRDFENSDDHRLSDKRECGKLQPPTRLRKGAIPTKNLPGPMNNKIVANYLHSTNVELEDSLADDKVIVEYSLDSTYQLIVDGEIFMDYSNCSNEVDLEQDDKYKPAVNLECCTDSS